MNVENLQWSKLQWSVVQQFFLSHCAGAINQPNDVDVVSDNSRTP